MKNVEAIKKTAKELGIKGFRRLKLKREVYTIGRQCQKINKHMAERLVAKIELNGYRVQEKSTIMGLIEKDLVDTISITPA